MATEKEQSSGPILCGRIDLVQGCPRGQSVGTDSNSNPGPFLQLGKKLLRLIGNPAAQFPLFDFMWDDQIH